MAAPPLTNSFEGGVAGNTIATSDTGSGNAWNLVTIGTSATLTYSNTQAHGGALSMRIVEPVTGVATFVAWNALGTLTGDVYGRFYVFLPVLPNIFMYVTEVRTAAAANSATLSINTDGTLWVQNAAFGNVGNGVKATPTGQWVRIEYRVRSSATVGQFEWKMFSSLAPGNGPEGDIPTETANLSSLVLGSDTDRLDFGIPNTSTPTSQTFYFDDIAVSTAGWIGPSGSTVTRTFNPIPFVAPGRI